MIYLHSYRIHIAVVLLFFLSAFSAGAQEQKPAAPQLGPQIALTSSGEATLLRAKESFSSLSLKDSDLHAEPPLLGEKEETKTFVRELWQVRWRPNDPIDLYVIRPVGVKNPPVVLYLYGFPSETDRFKDDRYCQRVTQNGAAAIGFVSAFTGHRDEYRPPKQWFISELPESLATTVHDVQMILNYLDTRGDLDMSRVGMFGQGSGGAIAILAAAADSRLKALDLLDPWGDWPEWLAKAPMVPDKERADYLKADFLKRLEPLEPVYFLPELQSRSMRIQFVDDNGEPKEASSKLSAAAPAVAKVIQYHDGLQFRSAVSGGGLFVWIANELKPQRDSKTESKEITAQTKPAR
ncbi:MAG TPA: hypothetical protein VK699_01230 [Terriglobales bacterium]|nr:hypothetical protein [Terriglobales bacterium]